MESPSSSPVHQLKAAEGIPIAVAAGKMAVEGAERRKRVEGEKFNVDEELKKYTKEAELNW
jgi:hypothetical protein